MRLVQTVVGLLYAAVAGGAVYALFRVGAPLTEWPSLAIYAVFSAMFVLGLGLAALAVAASPREAAVVVPSVPAEVDHVEPLFSGKFITLSYRRPQS